MPWERRRPRRHTAQPCPRGTGDGAPTTGGGMVDSLPPGQARRISISPVRVLMSREEEYGSKTKPSVECTGPCAGSRSCIPRWRSKDVCLAATTVPGLVSPAGGGGHAPRVAGGGRLRVVRTISTGQRGASGQSGEGRRGGLCGPRGRAAEISPRGCLPDCTGLPCATKTRSSCVPLRYDGCRTSGFLSLLVFGWYVQKCRMVPDVFFFSTSSLKTHPQEKGQTQKLCI